MNEYVLRLEKCGVSASRAYRFCFDFMKNFGLAELELFIRDIEAEVYMKRSAL